MNDRIRPPGKPFITAVPRSLTPRARHHRRPGPITVTPAVEALLRRTRLTDADSGQLGQLGQPGQLSQPGRSGWPGRPGESFRVAGIPVLIAAVVASGPGWTTYIVRDGDSLSTIARRHGTDPHALARVNGLGDADRVRAGRSLSVPLPPASDSSRTRRRAAASGLHPVDTSGAPVLSYRVRDGDTVASIAARSGSSMRAVLAANGMRPTCVVKPGQLLMLPSLTLAETDPPRARRSATRPVVHVMRRGDTIATVAHRYRLPVAEVLAANQLSAQTRIRPGHKLLVPGARPQPARPVGTTSAHVVRRGETVTAIARRYGVAVNAVLAVNHLRSRTEIQPGRRLLVPVGSSTGGRAGRHRARQTAADLSIGVRGRTYPAAVVRAAAANRAALNRIRVPDRAQVQDLIRAAAYRTGVDPALALAVGSMESGFDQRLVSPANAIGVMQVLPSTGTWAGELIGRRLDLTLAEDNITAGVVLLAALCRRGDEQSALAGYYQGAASVRRHGMFADTRRYVATVRTLKLRFR